MRPITWQLAQQSKRSSECHRSGDRLLKAGAQGPPPSGAVCTRTWAATWEDHLMEIWKGNPMWGSIHLSPPLPKGLAELWNWKSETPNNVTLTLPNDGAGSPGLCLWLQDNVNNDTLSRPPLTPHTQTVFQSTSTVCLVLDLSLPSCLT